MSKKQWFILRVDHHLGPFSHEELIDLYERAKLREDDQLWREGMDHWQRFDQIEEFTSILTPPPVSELPPDLPVDFPEDRVELPPLPPVDEGENAEEPPSLPITDVPHETEETKVEDEVFKEVFDDHPSPEVFEFEEDDTEIKELADLADETEDESRPSQLKRSVAVVVCLVVLSTGLMFFFQDLSRAPEFFEMRLQQAQEVKSFLKKHQGAFSSEDMPMFLGLSRDSHSLVLATPYSGPAKLFLRLESVEGEGLFETPVIVTASAQLENYKAIFDELTWQQGRSLVPGYYRYEVSAIPTGVTAQLRGALQRAGFAEDAPTPFKGSGKVLLSRWDRETFQKKWEKFQSSFLAKRQAPLEETLQRYQTLEGLADQILSLYNEVLPTVEKPEDMQLFENRYSREIAGLLQVLILEAHKKVNVMKGDDSQIAKAYESLRELGKNIGGVVSDMLTTTRETPQLDDKKKARLKKMFENRIKSLTQETQERQQFIREKLQAFESKPSE